MSFDPVERLSNYLERIERDNPKLNAYLDLRLDAARCEAEASARRFHQGEPLSAIDGQVIAVKANIGVQGLPCHGGIAAYRDQIASNDAAVITRLKAAGVIILGLVNMEEGALGAVTDNPHFGKTFNPWGDNLTPGGSSGGSGAAVAAGLCDGALGSDTMGSTRVPASYCGVYGHKPSRERVPFDGVIALSTTLDHIGPIAHDAAMLAHMDGVLSGTPVATPLTLEGLTIGRWRFESHVQIDPDVMALFEAMLARLKDAGAQIVDITLPQYEFGRSRRDGLIISEVEGFKIHQAMLAKHPDGFSKPFRALLEYGAKVSADRLKRAYAVLDTSAEDAAFAFGQCDILTAPTTLETAFEFGQPVPAGQADLTAFADFAGIAATAMPSGLTVSGLPASIQFMAPKGQDARSLGLVRALEALIGPPALPGAR